ncbi:unnamed protein product, partial [Rotaria magnacalcarata]
CYIIPDVDTDADNCEDHNVQPPQLLTID